jgi:hypothetical protein
MSVPVTLTGLGITLLGAALSVVPVLNIASPLLMKTGGTIIIAGTIKRAVRVKKGGEVLNNTEKAIINKFKPKGK